MKRFIALLVFAAAACGAAAAQIREVVVDIRGNFEVVVRVADDTYAVVSEYGQLLDIYEHEPGPRWRGRDPRFFSGVDIKFYDDFWDYQAGKVESIGGVRFQYNNDFWDYNARKLSRVGSTSINYHNDFWDYSAGKVESIGGIRFDYHDSFSIGSEGLIERINNERYEYSLITGRGGNRGRPTSRPSSGRERDRWSSTHRPGGGMIISGRPELEIGGVMVTIVERLHQ
jgi:hypothetical protein